MPAKASSYLRLGSSVYNVGLVICSTYESLDMARTGHGLDLHGHLEAHWFADDVGPRLSRSSSGPFGSWHVTGKAAAPIWRF